MILHTIQDDRSVQDNEQESGMEAMVRGKVADDREHDTFKLQPALNGFLA
jgi:hypothetical protein